MSLRAFPMRDHEVRATLDGRETQFRRVVKPQPVLQGGLWDFAWGAATSMDHMVVMPNHRTANACPYGQPGDLLWVREAYRLPAKLDGYSVAVVERMALEAGYHRPWAPIYYEADGRKNSARRESTFAADWGTDGKLRPSIHMPRWASRLTLRVVDVRVERLQAISEVDALAEGLDCEHAEGHGYVYATGRGYVRAREAFADLWDSINGKRHPWDSNPWVWAVTFEVVP